MFSAAAVVGALRVNNHYISPLGCKIILAPFKNNFFIYSVLFL